MKILFKITTAIIVLITLTACPKPINTLPQEQETEITGNTDGGDVGSKPVEPVAPVKPSEPVIPEEPTEEFHPLDKNKNGYIDLGLYPTDPNGEINPVRVRGTTSMTSNVTGESHIAPNHITFDYSQFLEENQNETYRIEDPNVVNGYDVKNIMTIKNDLGGTFGLKGNFNILAINVPINVSGIDPKANTNIELDFPTDNIAGTTFVSRPWFSVPAATTGEGNVNFKGPNGIRVSKGINEKNIYTLN